MAFQKGFTPWNKGKKTGIVPKTAFKKGTRPWNKGKKGLQSNTGRTHFKKGMVPWNKGEKLSKEHIQKLKESHLGYIAPESQRLNQSRAAMGRKKSLEHCKNISDGRKKIMTKSFRKEMSRYKKAYFDKLFKSNGIERVTAEDMLTRHGLKYRLWRKLVMDRDNYICQMCFIRGGKLQAHHKKSFSRHKELRFDINNGITFCETCHKIFHKIYGYFNNTKKQFCEFML